jgi:hypothetical protein
MGTSGQIESLAKDAVFSESRDSREGKFLWDSVKRISRNTELVSNILEQENPDLKIRRSILKAGACFLSLAELKLRISGGGFHNGDYREKASRYCSELVSEKLSRVMAASQISDVNSLIAESYNKKTRRVEAKIISDARNLDDVGLLGLFWEIRRSVLSGRSVSDVIAGWKRKMEYGYWQARLDEDFRFKQVRRIAEQRLDCAQSFMDCLEGEHNGQSVEKLAASFAEAG